MLVPFEQLLQILIGECYARRNAIFVMFVAISLSLLVVGSMWPKRYTSSVVIHADKTNILQPLMEGTAEATHVVNHVSNTREIIFGEKIMNQVIKDAGWLKTSPSDVQQEQIKTGIIESVTVARLGDNLIKISYTDNEPMRSYITVKRMAELFLQEGERSKINESEAAYQFIEKQVNEYLNKLTSVEESLRIYRSDNPDSRPGLETAVSARISKLTNNIEQARLQLRETQIRRNSLKEQLSGEAAITISQSKEGQYRSKIAESQSRLEALRLDYKDTYPDIIRLKHQIEDLKESMRREKRLQIAAKAQAKNTGDTYIDESIILNPLYQRLRSDISTTETQIATLNARISEMDKMLNSEFERSRRIHDGETVLAKLTRGYQVNQEIYQDLLRRREKARVSRSLDQEQQGLTFKIQEPAKIALVPAGIRFLHFAIAGLVLGLAVPIGLIYVLLQIDPRIRFSRVISSELELPVLAEITRISSMKEERKIKINMILLITGTGIVLLIYGYVGWLKFSGQL